MAKSSNVHWTMPLTMLSALVTGVLFALGHHLFYQSLAGTETPTGTYNLAGADISRQQLNTAVGTAFGFLVKSCLVVATSIAFVQAFWRAVRTSIEGPTLSTLDSASDLLNSFVGIFERGTWAGFSVPLTIAVIAWYRSPSCTITPIANSNESRRLQLPTCKSQTSTFITLDFAAPIPQGPDGYCFNGPSQPVQRVVSAVAAQGQILAIPAPAPNVSWSLDFWAPSLQCHDLSGSERESIWSNILDNWNDVSDCSYAYGYLAWTAGSNSSLPFIKEDNKTVLQSSLVTYGSPASIYIATLPQFFNFVFLPSDAATEKCQFFGSDSSLYTFPTADDICLPGLPAPACYGSAAWTTDATLLRCDVLNSSHSATFDYTNGIQSIDVTIGTAGSSVPVIPQQCYSVDNNTINGAQDVADGATQFDAATSRLLSYQGIVSAFNHVILGSISMGGYGRSTDTMINTISAGDSSSGAMATAKTPGIMFNAGIVMTMLMDTAELAFITDFDGVNSTSKHLQTKIGQVDDEDYRGMTNGMPTGTRGDLKSALEMLFQNITISVLAEEYLQPDYSSPYAPARLTRVTFDTYHNIYVYSATTLVIAYGLAILFTLVAMGIGGLAMYRNNAAYSGSFSTVLRVAKSANIAMEVLDEESDGRQQPLPRRLAMAFPQSSTKAMTSGAVVTEDVKGPTVVPEKQQW